ncbi:MAG: nucleotidyltransferase family protein [Clostridiales bacterium]|nr:nucleotidyltransferase family protein [Clostridiales bacterium]
MEYLLTNVISHYLDYDSLNEHCLSESHVIEKLIFEANEHQLFCLIYDYLNKYKKNETDILSKYRSLAYQQVLNCKRRTKFALKVFEFLNKSDVDYVSLKGITFKRLYPNPDLRLMSDIDIYVKPEKLDIAVKVLEKVGYSIDVVKEHECNLYLTHPAGIAIELHHKLFSDSIFGDKHYLETVLFDDVEVINFCNTEIKVPSKEKALAYSMLHMTKHFAVTGFGVRQLLDITLFLDKYENVLDLYVVRDIFEKYDVLFFAGYLLEICNRSFNRKFHIFEVNIDEEKLNDIFDRIKNAGVYGHRNIENDIESEYLLRSQSSSGKLKNPMVTKVQLLFPKSNKLGERYLYARKNKLLLPFAWSHRLIYNVFSQNENVKRLVKTTPDSTDLNNRLELLKYFNLEKKF